MIATDIFTNVNSSSHKHITAAQHDAFAARDGISEHNKAKGKIVSFSICDLYRAS